MSFVKCRMFTCIVSFCRHGHAWARADAVQSWWPGPDKCNYYFTHTGIKTCLILHQWFIIIPSHPCIQGNASFRRQLQFLQQLLSVVPACNKSCGARADAELLLNELFSAENQHLLSQMLQPSLEPWPSHMKYVCWEWLGLYSFMLYRSLVNLLLHACQDCSLSQLLFCSQDFTKGEQVVV